MNNYKGDQFIINGYGYGSINQTNVNQGANQMAATVINGAKNMDMNYKGSFAGMTKLPKGKTVRVNGNAYRDADTGVWYTNGTYTVEG